MISPNNKFQNVVTVVDIDKKHNQTDSEESNSDYDSEEANDKIVDDLS